MSNIVPNPDPNKARSPREEFLQTMKGVNESKEEARRESMSEDDQIVEDAAEILDRQREEEKEDSKFEMTADQFQVAKKQQEALGALKGLKSVYETTLSKADQAKLDRLVNLVNDEKITDPVAIHLVNQKVELTKSFLRQKGEIQQMQAEMFQKMADISNGLTKSKGALESVDKQLLGLDLPLIDPEG